MNDKLYKFLKDKDYDFCYVDKKPFLVNSYIHIDIIEEYLALLNNDINNVYKESLSWDFDGSAFVSSTNHIESIKEFKKEIDKLL